jgi:hypothetical protein
MGRINQYAAQLEPLLADPANATEVERLLLAESGLPGPRGNLELVEAFARSISTTLLPGAWLGTLYDWADIDAEQAPTGDPREFLAFCAVVAFGTLYHTHACAYPCSVRCDCPHWPVQDQYIVETIRRAAVDPRWRLREAAAMALQHLGEGDSSALRETLASWLNGPSLLEQRAALAALAHPPLLRDRGMARFALRAGNAALKKLAALPAVLRRGEDFRVLVKGMSYALSVLVASLPEEGFALLDRWSSYAASRGDAVLKRILEANRGKRRLQALRPQSVGRSAPRRKSSTAGSAARRRPAG